MEVDRTAHLAVISALLGLSRASSCGCRTPLPWISCTTVTTRPLPVPPIALWERTLRNADVY